VNPLDRNGLIETSIGFFSLIVAMLGIIISNDYLEYEILVGLAISLSVSTFCSLLLLIYPNTKQKYDNNHIDVKISSFLIPLIIFFMFAISIFFIIKSCT